MKPKLLRPQTMANVWCFISKAKSGNRVFAFGGSSFWEPVLKMLCLLGPPLDSLLISVLLVPLRSPPSPRAEICFSLLTSPGPGLQPWLPESDEKLLLWLFYSNELYTEPVQSENTRPFTETLLWISRQGHQSIKLRVEPLWAQGNGPGHTPRKPALTTDVSNLASARSSPSSSSHLHRLLLPGSSSPRPALPPTQSLK